MENQHPKTRRRTVHSPAPEFTAAKEPLDSPTSHALLAAAQRHEEAFQSGGDDHAGREGGWYGDEERLKRQELDAEPDKRDRNDEIDPTTSGRDGEIDVYEKSFRR